MAQLLRAREVHTALPGPSWGDLLFSGGNLKIGSEKYRNSCEMGILKSDCQERKKGKKDRRDEENKERKE